MVKLGLKPQVRKSPHGRKPAKKAVAKRSRTPVRKPVAKRAVRRTRI
jgi:hypothetical protein